MSALATRLAGVASRAISGSVTRPVFPLPTAPALDVRAGAMWRTSHLMQYPLTLLAQCTYSEGAVFVTRLTSRIGLLPPVQNGRNSSKGGSNDGSGSRKARQRGTALAAGPVPMVHGVPLAKASGMAVQPRLCS